MERATSAVIVAARRSPITTAGRGLAELDAAGLAGPVLAAIAADLPPAAPVEQVILGNCRGPGGNPARIAALSAGLGEAVAGLTVDGQCGSGLDAVRLGAGLVAAGTAGPVLAGGTESASQAAPGRARFAPDGFPDPEMGEAAEQLAEHAGISRVRQDAYAERSHQRAAAAAASGVFAAELVPVAGVDADDRPRPRLSRTALAKFKPAFAANGTVTAGNSCGINDGAAAVALVSEATRAAAGLPGLRIVAASALGVPTALPGLGAAAAARQVLAAAGLDLAAVGVVEIVEAFAAQVLACTDALGLDPLGADAERVCPQGGAIGLGHPWGASGTMLLVRLFASMVRRPELSGGARFGLAACAVGGGQGTAILVERVG